MMRWVRRILGTTVLMAMTFVAFADPPPFSGIVVRDSDPSAFTWIDAEAGLRVVVGADMDEYCAGIINFDLIAYQDVNLSSGRIVSNMRGFMQTTVWDFLEFDCDLFTSVDPVASGFANFRWVDNDLLASDNNNNYAWTWMVHGKLEDPWGSRMILSGHISRVFGAKSGFRFNSQIVLH